MGDSDDTYVNRVIIPDENTMISTRGIHLVMVNLNVSIAVIMDMATMVRDKLIGFIFFVVFRIITNESAVIFLFVF